MRLFTAREVKLIAIGVGAATLLAIAISVTISLARNRSKSVAVRPQAPYELRVSDLEIPEEYVEFALPDWYVYRPRLSQWNAEQVRRFWVDPQEVELERLSRQNDERMRALFEHVP